MTHQDGMSAFLDNSTSFIAELILNGEYVTSKDVEVVRFFLLIFEDIACNLVAV